MGTTTTKRKPKEPTYCPNCGSRTGLDCGDAEPDYQDFCSKGCFEEYKKPARGE